MYYFIPRTPTSKNLPNPNSPSKCLVMQTTLNKQFAYAHTHTAWYAAWCSSGRPGTVPELKRRHSSAAQRREHGRKTERRKQSKKRLTNKRENKQTGRKLLQRMLGAGQQQRGWSVNLRKHTSSLAHATVEEQGGCSSGVLQGAPVCLPGSVCIHLICPHGFHTYLLASEASLQIGLNAEPLL